MASSLTAVKTTLQLLALTACPTSLLTKGPATTLGGALGGKVHVKFGRLASGSMAAPVFKIQSFVNNDWIDIAQWTTSNHGLGAAVQTLTSGAAAGATGVQLSAALASGMSAPWFVFNAGTTANSEWNGPGGPASTAQVLADSLINNHTANVAMVTTNAEKAVVGLNFEDVSIIRFVYDPLFNAVAAKAAVQVDLLLNDNIISNP